MRSIYVLDTETTGLQGIDHGDKVVEIGIARVDVDRGKVFPEFGRVVRQDLSPEDKNAWVFFNTDLTPEDVSNSPWDTVTVGRELMYYEYTMCVFTSYNEDFDFSKFMNKPPWFFYPKLAPCIMEETAARYSPDGRWFSAQAAYSMLCPDNPAGLPDGKEQHRALSDAVVEGHILIRLLEQNEDIAQRYYEVLED